MKLQSGVANSRLEGNPQSLTPQERWQRTVEACGLSVDDAVLLEKPGALALATADGMIENVVGTFELPLGMASTSRSMVATTSFQWPSKSRRWSLLHPLWPASYADAGASKPP